MEKYVKKDENYVKIKLVDENKKLELVDESDVKPKGQKGRDPKGNSKRYNEYLNAMKKLTETNYYNNIYCSLYLGDYIEKYIINAMGGENLPYTTVRREGIGGQPRPVDFLLNWNGKKLKVKSVSSCCVLSDLGWVYWKYNISRNRQVDAFLLTAFDTKEHLQPQYMWFIMKDKDFETESTCRPFWDRDSLLINDNKKDIAMMKEYELNDQLILLKEMMVDLVSSFEKENKAKLMLLKRQKNLMAAGHCIGLEKLAKRAILDGIDKIIPEDILKEKKK